MPIGRAGVARQRKVQKEKTSIQTLGENVREVKLVTMRDQLQRFHESLERFALEHKEDVRKHPTFRAQFHEMCARVGVDPLASNKGFWSEMLGLGEFYYELGVQTIEACLVTKKINGGLTELSDLRRLVQKRRGTHTDPITEDDLVRAVEKLKVLGGGLGLCEIGKRRFVRSVPTELQRDHTAVLVLAESTGYVSKRSIREHLGWSTHRVEEALGHLLQDGLAMIDEGTPDGEVLYWFPCASWDFQ
mmetsp:Transcript_12492/g.45543  ORF Transcript_12492/g.45543 Transcript_12492/m.45543 type:complete len:246 (-) Transcript_12492:1565-2302(-)